MAQIIKTTGEVIEVSPKNGTDFKLREMQNIVKHGTHRHIEIVYLPNNKLMVCNEEGKLIGAPLNHKATDIIRCWYNDYVCGDVLVCDENEIK